jgi:hypothetical protein
MSLTSNSVAPASMVAVLMGFLSFGLAEGRKTRTLRQLYWPASPGSTHPG